MKNKLVLFIIALAIYPFMGTYAEDSICGNILRDSTVALTVQAASADNDTEEQVPQIMHPSPTVQALCRYGETPVGYATGIPEITIPLYTVKCGSLELPITLSYHAGGIKVDDIASWVGLGWSLNAGGVIGITTVGHSDSFINRADTLPSYTDVVNDLFTGLSSTELLNAYNTSCKDYQPDIFTYNFSGHNGQMMYDGDKAQWLNFAGDKSIRFGIPQSTDSLTATDNKGNRFVFREKETNCLMEKGTPLSTAYCMSEYVSHDSEDYINFYYTHSTEYDNVRVMSPLVYGASGNKKWEQLGNIQGTNKIGGRPSDFMHDYRYYYVTKKLSRIKASNGTTVEFIHDTVREDLTAYPSTQDSSKKLSGIIIYDANGSRIKCWEFLYDYFIAGTTSSYCSAHNKRLKLTGLREYGATDTEPKVYLFSYYGDSEGEPAMPHRNAYSGKDAWGYCNGMPTQMEAVDSMMSYPDFEDTGFCLYYRDGQTVKRNENLTLSYSAGRDINANPSFVHAYSLKQITYPAGGYERFIYEPNHYSVIDRFRTQNERPDTISCHGGGIRIKQIISCSGESTATRTFEYSEGNVPRHPHFLKRRFYEERTQPNDFIQRRNTVETYLQLCPGAVNTSYIPQSNSVMYPLVREIRDDGYVEYTHTMLEDTTDPDMFNYMHSGFAHFLGTNFNSSYVCQVKDGCLYYTTPNSTIMNTDSFSDYMGYNGAFFRRGQPESKKYYDRNGYILKEEEYSYTSKDIRQIAGMELRREMGLDQFDTYGLLYGSRIEFFYYTVYWMTTGTSLLTGKDVTTHFYANGKHTSNTVRHKYNYTADNLLKEETITDCNGGTVTASTLYPSEIDALPYTKMVEANMLDYPVEQTVSRGGNVARFFLTEYTEYGNSYYPKSGYAYKPSDINPDFIPYNGIRASYYVSPEYVIDAYEHGRITRMTTKGNLRHSYSWGYNNEYPVMEITDNVYHEEASPEVRQKAHVREFTYAPQVGVTSETLPNGLRNIYDYDTMGRLARKRFTSAEMMSDFTTECYSYNESGSGNNYTMTETMSDEDGYERTTEITYYDGLNRPVETVADGLNTTGKYVASHITYDDRGRASETWLPVISGTSSDYVTYSSVVSLARSTYSDEHACSHKSYDILDRPLKETTPGAAWHSGGKGVTYEYMTNSANSVMKYDAPCGKNSLVKDGYYAANILTSVNTTDEDGHTLEVFSDFEGRKILERRDGNNDTYFVYNVLGQLRYVLTPQYQTDKAKDIGAYEYRYDANGNVVKKILPGCEYIQYWYDEHDRVIAMQDGRMRIGSGTRHCIYVYDRLGRLAIQGYCSGLAHPGANLAVMDTTAPHDKTKDSGGYTIEHPYYFNNPKAEIANYYDNYAFVDYCGALMNLPTDSLRQELIQKPGVEFRDIEYGKGQMTGQLVVDSEKNYTLTAFFYDIRGNMIASRSISSDGTYTSTRNDYTFLNTVKSNVRTLIRHFGTPNAQKTTTALVNTYDERSGKLLHADLAVTDGSFSTSRRIESYDYDDLGRVSRLVQGNGAHTASYGYDLHGWTTSVAGDAFTESLGYASGASPCYNGSISSMEWMNADDRLARSYSFKYDGLNRLSDATYDDAGGGKNHYNETVSYNANGSPVTIKRNGRNDSGSYTAIDDLKLSYTGPRLRAVTDKGEACTYTGATDFKDGASTSQEYTYNACGALTSDANKGMASIGYGYWGTPSGIQFTNGCQTQYVYDANGTKLKRIYITAVDNIVVPLRTTITLTDDQILASDTTEYFGNLIFENGRLAKILFSSGYVSCSDNTPEHFAFHYYVKDHLGNNRAVVSENGAIEQSTHYYPFGNSFADAGKNPSLQQYKYNGKKLDRMHGLDWYDYGARNYDPVILIWDRMDQLCEDYYHVSPYVYCMDNPMNATDPDGLFPEFLITFIKTPFYRADYYVLNPQTCHLLSLVSGVPETYIRNAQIMQRGIGHYYPLYSSNNGGGAITLGNSPDNVSINFTPNYFEDDKKQYNGHGYGQDFYSWMILLSHEVGHIKHIGESQNELSYIIGFGLDYLKYGHDNTPREKEADKGYNNFKAFNKFVNDTKGKNALEYLFKSNKTSELQIQIVNEWWSEYEKK
ncbi:MAG: DUF6443 domain-containing protein [Bacteroidales bacterium]|nr:DUF6443 domain-containing protein [Bacteroidales bacterium]